MKVYIQKKTVTGKPLTLCCFCR